MNRILSFVLCLITIIITLYLSWLLYLSNAINLFEVITVIIGFLTIFTTGFGAYIGAKISGENSIKLMKNELIMSDLQDKSTNNLMFLSLYEKKMATLIETRNDFKAKDMSDFIRLKYIILPLFSTLKTLSKESDETSQVIKYPFESHLRINDEVIKKIQEIEKQIKLLIEFSISKEFQHLNFDYVELNNYELWRIEDRLSNNHNETEIDYFLIEVIEHNIDDYQRNILRHGTKIINNKEFNVYIVKELKSYFIELEKLLNKSLDHYQNMKFKTSEDLIQYINDYYKSDL